jgi:hypothetical protein
MLEEENGVLPQSCLSVIDSLLGRYKCTDLCLAIPAGPKTGFNTTAIACETICMMAGRGNKGNKCLVLGLGQARGQQVSIIGYFGVGFYSMCGPGE